MATPRAPFVCASCARTLRSTTTPKHTARAFTTISTNQQLPVQDLPRWQQPPPRMKAAFRLRPMPNQPEWRVNDKIEPLNEMYDNFIGRAGEGARDQAGVQGTKGSDLLPEEVKWLAITHKSHDHGRLGFNDRLALLGKRLVDLHTSIALLHAPAPPATSSTSGIYAHPALHNLSNITKSTRAQILSPARLAKLAQGYGMDRVVRWKPKKSGDLKASGSDTVLAHAVYAVVGAVALQRGGEVAGRVVREKVLAPLGLRSG
ncbi:hypothetical protein LTR62_008523 [Meristemomyces frigidus]|uniref:RNase III domain-containing protein n=1 Tax=Meristemomyces frigidus TaxID=1508187 RepID=A0AAN7TH50_9PEZI|nr:hypothetical protein LTR62_008523 [Meristemomyces frigidus]